MDARTHIRARPAVPRWRAAIFVIFLLNGAYLATVMSRSPGIREALEISRGQFGLLLFSLAAGSVLGLFLSSPLLARMGARASMATSLAGMAVGLGGVAVGVGSGANFWVTAVGLLVLGLALGSCDVVMNVEGASLERTVNRSTLPLLHAGFSLGGVAGAVAGTAAAATGLPLGVHFTVALAVALTVGAVVLPWVPPRASPGDPAPAGITAPVARPTLRERLSVWADPRLLLIGVVMLGMSFSEGGANDWIAVATVDGHGGTEAQGALVLAVFVSFMAAGRLRGGRVVDRFGRVVVIRVSAVIAALGIALFILAPAPWAVFAGAGLWGLGSCLGFPLGMSAAADDPTTAARRVAAVAVIGYLAFLAGPPVLGLVSEAIGILATLWILFGLVVLSLLAAPATREPDDTAHPLGRTSASARP